MNPHKPLIRGARCLTSEMPASPTNPVDMDLLEK